MLRCQRRVQTAFATLAALRGELGPRPPIGTSTASVALAIAVGAALARLLGTA